MADKTIAHKLMLKRGSLLLVNAPEGYLGRLGPLPPAVSLVQETKEPVEAIQVFVANRRELEAELPRLKGLLKPGGMLWVSYHKGGSRTKTDINRDSIWAYAQTIGLQAVAQIAVDDDWSAMRLKWA